MKSNLITIQRMLFVMSVTILSLSATGCEGMSRQGKDTAIGAGAGAIGGAVLTGGSAIGTVGGAAVGGVIGNEVGKNKK